MSAPVDAEFEDVICTCDDERRAGAAALRESVTERLAAGSYERAPHEVTPATFATDVVWSLNWDCDARITQIAGDLWFGVWAENGDKTFTTRIQCDAVEDGLAATWRAFADRSRPPKSEDG